MKERHRRILIKLNPQWRDEKIEACEFRRDPYEILSKGLNHPQILGIVGLRRVGKTVLLKQMMRELQRNVPGSNLGYISFDDRDFQNYETADELIDYFLTFSDPEHMRYMFLDEIQKVPHWPDLLKNIYDSEKRLKIIISGSSSLEMKDHRETLAGRIMIHNIPVFTFSEYVRYYGLPGRINANDLARDYDLRFLLNKERYRSLFEDYLLKGAFPELLDSEDEEYITQYIKESIVEKVIADVSRNVKPRREDIASDLLHIFSRNTARLFDITNIANALGIDRNLTSKYINALKNSFLIKVDYNYTKSALKQARTGKKSYIAHSCISIVLMGYPQNIALMEGSSVGYLVETVIANGLDHTNFWRSAQRYEVDIIVPGPVPIEVKYRERTGKDDMRGLKKFMDTFKVATGILITKDEFSEEHMDGKRILRIPVWIFLLLPQDDLIKI